MKSILIVGLFGLPVAALAAGGSVPSSKIASAAKQLGEKANYSWTTTSQEADGSPGRLGTIEGKTEKGGVIQLNFTPGGIPVEVFLQGQKGAARAFEGWQTLDEIAQTSGTAAAVVRYLRSYQPPAALSADLAGKVKSLKEAEGAVAGELTEEAVKEMLLVGTRRREGQEPPKIADPKGTAKFWLQDGALAKYEITVQGKVTAGEREMDINRTMTTEIKDVCSTKLEVPAEAKAKLE